jgi:hypothetical protein
MINAKAQENVSPHAPYKSLNLPTGKQWQKTSGNALNAARASTPVRSPPLNIAPVN